MILPENDPHAKVAGSLEDLFTTLKQDSKVEVGFYPVCDVPEDMLRILNRIAQRQTFFNLRLEYDVKTCRLIKFLHGTADKKEFEGFDAWFTSAVPYVAVSADISLECARTFVKWSYEEMLEYISLMIPLCKKRGHRKDCIVDVNIRTSQHNATTAGSNVLYYHKDRQRYTVIKNYIGPSPVYAPRNMLYEYPHHVWRLTLKKPSELAKQFFEEYALPDTGVCLHKGQVAKECLKTFHRAVVSQHSKKARMILIGGME
jgi:hypothetical protein